MPLLLIGAVAGMIWANVDQSSYDALTRLTRFTVNDLGMVFFFALAMKEVVVAMMPGGPLGSFRQAGVPVLAALGGMAAPALLFTFGVQAIDRPDAIRGWAIPCATDIAFSYLAARLVFPRNHPAIPFLLLLAIADDAFGLIVLALFYPSGAVSMPTVIAYLAPAMLVAWVFRKLAVESFWVYILAPGVLAWTGMYYGGLHPALAMVPIVPFMPPGTLKLFERWWRLPVQVILMFFGLVNAGVPVSSVSAITWIIAGSLILGKPIGIVITTAIAELAGFRRAPGLDYRGLVVLGFLAGIGFTVALFFATASFPAGPLLEQAKMGALVSFLAAPIGFGVAWLLGVTRSSAPVPPPRTS